eukprot:TRINITY_DN4007_c0_g1_i2.p1 TRINITY_DN4007_c0_g1~~TRINITY_DN4007_c0_g1_i2.p1  ORF type:complete len:495 (+),score=61.47 TRINITY_DN4007_c0_g1_i2:30-1514(+)
MPHPAAPIFGGSRCDLPRVDARNLSWKAFRAGPWRGVAGVILTGLFEPEELEQWTADRILAAHGNETFNADDTRGRYGFPTVAEYVQAGSSDRAMFLTDTLYGLFGRSFTAASSGSERRAALLQDFAARPLFSLGVPGSGVPRHDGHWETWHALLRGSKAWWLGPPDPPEASVWDHPCDFRSIETPAPLPPRVSFCVQQAGEVLYFGEGITHSNCVLENFTLGVGAQGHTESWRPLARAANRGDVLALQSLAQRKKGPNLVRELRKASGVYGRTPLHLAALRGHGSAIEALVALRADVDALDGNGLTPMFLAAFSGHVQVIDLLAGLGNGLRSRDPKGASVLQWAATQGHVAVVEALVAKYGMDVSDKDAAGGGSVFAAATVGHASILELLHRHGADLQSADQERLQPLHFAAGHGHLSATAFLLQKQTRPVRRSKSGHLPLDLALGNGHSAVVALLRENSPVADDMPTGRQQKRSRRNRGRRSQRQHGDYHEL